MKQKNVHVLQVNSWKSFLLMVISAAVLAALTAWLVLGNIYHQLPDYEQFVAGFHIWDGYYKQGDVILFYLLTVLIPVYAALLAFIMRKRLLSEKSVSDRTDFRYAKKAADGVLSVLLGLYGIRAVFTAMQGLFGNTLSKRNLMSCVAVAVETIWIFFIMFAYFLELKCKKRILTLAQLCLPLQFLGMYRFCYDYEGEASVIVLFFTNRFKWFCIALCLVFLSVMLYRTYKKKSIYVCAWMLAAAESVMMTPEGRLSVDFFHNGEMALPMQQLLHFKRLPYWDLEPIHGLCDCYYSLVNVLLFDGSYLSQNAAVMTGNVLIALLLGAVMALCIENRYVSFAGIVFVLPYLIQTAGVRYLFFYIAFFLLLSERLQNDSRKFLWFWVLLCVLSITWNVAIGASVAVAFLPQALYLFFRCWIPKWKEFLQWEKKERTGYILAYGILTVVVISYLPLFIKILRYLYENTGTTVLLNGQQIFGEEFHPFKTFALFVPILLLTGYYFCGKGKAEFWAVITSVFLLINYICVRYDGGNRLEFAAVYFSLIFICMAVKEKESLEFTGGNRIRFGCILICCGFIFAAAHKDMTLPFGVGMKAEKVPATEKIMIGEDEITDAVVYLSGESAGLSRLGIGFIQASTLNSLKNIQKVFEKELSEEEDYVDFTNKISHYVIYDKECILPYTSVYNISNHSMQERAVAIIKEKKPRLILIAPCIVFDQVPISLRSYELYTAVMEMGYKPYYYEDVVYLLAGDSRFDEAKAGERIYGNYLHKRQLGMLPYLWGTALDEQKEYLEEEISLHTERSRDGSWTIFTEQAYDNTEFICLTIPKDAISGENLVFRFHSDVDGENYEFVIDSPADGLVKEDEITFLVPAASSPFWYFSDVKEFTLSGTDAVSSVSLIGRKE